MAGNLVVKHGPNRTMRPDKDKATEKIDGTVALVMALDIIVRQPADGDVSADDLVMVL
jgi:phage terminase large subunit-like protein